MRVVDVDGELTAPGGVRAVRARRGDVVLDLDATALAARLVDAAEDVPRG